MKIALIADGLTSKSLDMEVNIYHITPLNYKIILKYWKPDILFVESAWQGYKNRWKYKIAAYPDYPKRNNKKLKKVVEYAKKRGIPTVFWNKEDGVHFDRFIDSAKLFDYIFTVDENCIAKYKAIVNKSSTVNVLMFAIQPKIHNFSGFHENLKDVNFVGSYSHHLHSKRKVWQDMIFKSVTNNNLNLDVYDRNSNRHSKNYRYPHYKNMKILDAVSYKETAKIYKNYTLCLNVNTIEDSPTMFSRRLIEILACGGVAITNPSRSVDKMFKEYCYIIRNKEEADKLFEKIYRDGLSDKDKEMAKKASQYVLKYHTWEHRIDEIKKIIGL